MKKLAIILLSVVLVAVGALYAVTFIDINAYRENLSALVEEQTGRKLDLGGQLEVGFSLTPTIVARDVRFGNAAWGSEPTMLEADRVAIRLSLARLLYGGVDVSRLDVSGARVLLETGPDGTGNWVLDGVSDDTDDGDAELSTSGLPRVVLEDVRATYKSGRRGAATEIALTAAEIWPNGSGVNVRVSGDVDSNTASVAATIRGNAQSFRVTKLELTYGEIELSGQVSGNRSGVNSPITIDGELSATTIDLGALEAPSTGEEVQTGLFSADPLPFGALDFLNGEVDLAVETLTYKDLTFTDFHTAVTLKDGSLSAPVFVTYGERRVEMTVEAANTQVPRMSVQLSAPGIDIGQFLEQVGATDLIEVEGHIGLDLSSSGGSPADLASNLTGKVDVATGRGSIHSSAFEWIAKDLIWALIPKGGESGVADLTCFIGELHFNGGVGDVSALALVTDEIRTSGSGKINLRNETIDMRLDPRPNDPGLLSLATPVNVTGPLRSPSILPDTGALLGDLALAVGAGVLTGGIGAVLPLVSAEHFDADEASACLAMLGDGEGSANDAGILENAGEGAGDLIEGVGDILTSPFE